MRENEIKAGDCFKGFLYGFFLVKRVRGANAYGIHVSDRLIEINVGFSQEFVRTWKRIDRSEFESAFATIQNEVQDALTK